MTIFKYTLGNLFVIMTHKGPLINVNLLKFSDLYIKKVGYSLPQYLHVDPDGGNIYYYDPCPQEEKLGTVAQFSISQSFCFI